MSISYSPSPAILGATITLPQDLVDQRTAASVNVPFQALADAIAYLMASGTIYGARGCTSDLVMGNAAQSVDPTMVGLTTAAAETLSASNALLYADHLRFNVTTSGSAVALHAYFPLNSILVSGATITRAQLTLQGGPGHGALPALMPSLTIVRVKGSNNTQVGLLAAGVTYDASADVGTYEATHTIEVVPDQNNVVDFSDSSVYYAVVTNEGDTNALAELRLMALSVRMTAPRYSR